MAQRARPGIQGCTRLGCGFGIRARSLARAQVDAVELKNARLRGALRDADTVEREWTKVLRGVRAGMLAVPSRCAARLPHLTPQDVSEIDAEVRSVSTEIGKG